MEQTRQQLDKILQEIENGSGSSAAPAGNINEVMSKLLGRSPETPNTAAPAAAGQPGDLPMHIDSGELADSLQRCNRLYYNSFYRELPPAVGFKAKVKRLLYRVVRRLMRPILLPLADQQLQFNAAATQSLNVLSNYCGQNYGYLNILHAEQQMARQQLDQQQAGLNELQAGLKELQAGAEELRGEFHEFRTQDDLYERIDYEKFEDHFRGSAEEIKNRQREYLPYLAGKKDLLDIGCGRGEFLTLMRENGINGIGVDSYAPFVKKCREQGLNVYEDDGIRFLKNYANGSLDAVTAFQLAEHLKLKDIIDLCTAAYDKLRPGGCLIMETPNPTCLAIYTNAFYVDPSHKKPVHPETLKYLAQEAGFSRVEIVFTNGSRIPYAMPYPDIPGSGNQQQINDAVYLLNNLLWGSQDYAIVATR